MDPDLVLLVDPDIELRAAIIAACSLGKLTFVELDNEDTALDWIWERGKQVAAVFVQQTSSTSADPHSLVPVLARDWPNIRVIRAESQQGALSPGQSGIDDLPYPWTPWQVGQRLMTISAQNAA